MLGTDEAIAVAAIVVAIVGAFAIPRPPSTVASLTITNPSAYDVMVEVGNPRSGQWMSLGVIDSGATAVFTRVLDEGDEWGLRYRAQGVDGGEHDVARTDLDKARWHISVPDATIAVWHDRHVVATPCGQAKCPHP
jgi:hypothetical protein